MPPRLDLIDAERPARSLPCPDRPAAGGVVVRPAANMPARCSVRAAGHGRRCEEVEIILQNDDEVRHDLMIPGLNPMFSVAVVGPDIVSARFVTPDEDITLFLHCHVPMHDKVGMAGKLTVGKGGEPKTVAQAPVPSQGAATTFQGVGVVIAAVPRIGRLIVAHDEIKGFMGAMEMSYPVTPPALLNGLNPGDKIGFTIDAGKSTIVAIKVIEAAQ